MKSGIVSLCGFFSTRLKKRSALNVRQASIVFAVITGAAISSAIQAQTIYEAEALTRACSAGITTVVEDNSAYHGGCSVKVNGVGIGSYCEWTIPNVAAGTYTVAFYYKRQNSRSIVQASIDGVNQGTTIDMYGATDQVQVAAVIGSKTFTTAGNRIIRLAVTGKNAASTGYTMHIDYFVLTSVGCTAPTITTQPVGQTVSVGQTATFSISATGTATLTYQWRKAGAAIAGATAASYTTPAVTAGDNLSQFTCTVYNGCGNVTSAAAALIVSLPITVGFVDIDGNVYRTVKIGHQEWSAENLRVTKLNDGTSIPNVTVAGDWAGLTTPGYCWYNNDIGNKEPYGALYNWYAVNTGKLAPAGMGWRVPTDADWTALENYLMAHRYNYDFTTADNKIAKSMASQSHWETFDTEGSIGYDLMRNNSSGFSALPGGYRYFSGNFEYHGFDGFWWSTTENNVDLAWFRRLYYSRSDLDGRNDLYNKRFAFSVRLVRDLN
jgi:uncharacterized protein (TIGR02145 family)